MRSTKMDFIAAALHSSVTRCPRGNSYPSFLFVPGSVRYLDTGLASGPMVAILYNRSRGSFPALSGAESTPAAIAVGASLPDLPRRVSPFYTSVTIADLSRRSVSFPGILAVAARELSLGLGAASYPPSSIPECDAATLGSASAVPALGPVRTLLRPARSVPARVVRTPFTASDPSEHPVVSPFVAAATGFPFRLRLRRGGALVRLANYDVPPRLRLGVLSEQ